MAWAITPSTSSGELSASTQIVTRPAFLQEVELNPPSIGTATLKIYDSNSGASGTLLMSITVAAGQNTLYLSYPSGRVANRGIYVALTGTTTFVLGYSVC